MRVSPTMPYTDLPQDTPSHTPSAPSASQSRRAKNAAHRADDVGQYQTVHLVFLSDVFDLRVRV